MKTREQLIRTRLKELEDYIVFVHTACQDAGYENISEAYEAIIKSEPLSYDIIKKYGGWNSEEDERLMNLILGISEFEDSVVNTFYIDDMFFEELVSRGV